MKKNIMAGLCLLALTLISGCFMGIPTNFQPVDMVAGSTVSAFSVVGENLADFEWYLDGEIVSGQEKSVYLYAPSRLDVGMRRLSAKFSQDDTSYTYTWEIKVSARKILEGEEES
jgi:hypothetical protein